MQVSAPEAGESRSRQLLVPVGHWRHRRFGELRITPETIHRLAESFRRRLRTISGKLPRLPVTIEHRTADGAAGWIEDVEETPAGLIGAIRWTPLGVQAVRDDTHPYISPETIARFADSDGAVHEDVLEGASLVTRPFFRELDAVEIHDFADEPIGVLVLSEVDMPEPVLDQVPAQGQPDPTPTPEEAAAATPTVAPPAGAAPQTFAEPADDRVRVLEDEVAELRREALVRRFADDLAVMTFGDPDHPHRMAPACRSSLAELLAEIAGHDVALAERAAQALGVMRFYDPGVVGVETLAEQAKPLSDSERLIAAQLGLSEEEMRR